MKPHEFRDAAQLPETWDKGLGSNIYLTRRFLHFMQGRSDVEDCRYVMFTDESGTPDTRFMLFTRGNYVFTQFTRVKLRARTRFIYVPLSVARAGVHLAPRSAGNFFSMIRKLRGLRLIFNLPEHVVCPGFIQVQTCPRCVLDVCWNSFEDYLGSLRSHYRSRYKKALKRSAELVVRKLEDNSRFDEKLYSLYLQVLDHAEYTIETLGIDFFRGDFFDIFIMEDAHGTPLAFYQLLANKEELIFEFTGFDAEKLAAHDGYNRMLLEIIRYAIENGFKRIDFGQTAETAKLRVGCRYENIYVLAGHSNPFFHFLLKLFAPLLHYKPVAENSASVFKNTGGAQ